MALAKDPICSVVQTSEPYKFDERGELEKPGGGIVKNFPMTTGSSSPDSVGSDGGGGFVFHPPEEVQSLINFKGSVFDNNFIHGTGTNYGSLLSFEQNEKAALENTYNLKSGGHKDDYPMWDWNQMNTKTSAADPRLVEDFSCFETASNFSSITKENSGDWLFSESTVVADSIPELRSPEAAGVKRPKTGDGSNQGLKKQCSNEAKKAKTNKSGPAKDPQSIAAKNRRERISERLKILQELVPNGSKVDLVTMLEKAISYVKFLQLQVKVLATDEFWPVQGGKAPDISQVREAIDAILSSQKDRNSSSSK